MGGSSGMAIGSQREGLERNPVAPDRLDQPFSDPLVQRLFPPLASGVHWGLERTCAALEDLGNPHHRFTSVHVGGTNGKGSVAASIHSILLAAGHRAGLYTSPHLCSFRERYMLDGGPVAEEVILKHAREIQDVVVDRGLTFFEAVTVLGFQLFAKAHVDVVVAEVGLGGRLDATNVLTPAVATITNVAMDHSDYLGDTLAEIATEKAGIIKAGVPVVTAERDPDLLSVFRATAVERGAPFHSIDPETELDDLAIHRRHTAFTYRTSTLGTLDLRTPLVGRHQASNAALAVATTERLPTALRPDREAVLRGLRSVRWPGRDQIETIEGVTWLFDVAHNVAGVYSLVDTLDRLDLPRPWVALVGVLGDKDWPAMLPPLLQRVDSSWLTLPASGPPERRWDPAAAVELLNGRAGPSFGLIQIELDFHRALKAAGRAAQAEGTVVVTGSVYTVGSALEALGRLPFFT